MTRTPHKSSEQSSNQKTGKFVYVVTAIAALGGLLFGYDTGVISGGILYIKTAIFALSHLARICRECRFGWSRTWSSNRRIPQRSDWATKQHYLGGNPVYDRRALFRVVIQPNFADRFTRDCRFGSGASIVYLAALQLGSRT